MILNILTNLEMQPSRNAPHLIHRVTSYEQTVVSQVGRAADNLGHLFPCSSAPSSAGPVTPRTALPGTVNYVEGQVSIDGNPLNSRQDGNTQVQPNQSLMTANGKAEMLLSPGVFVRAGNNSDIRMVSNGLANPTIEVVRGEAMVEVDQKATDAQIDVLEHGATASILKYGLYRFDGDQGRIEVIDGKLEVTENGKTKDLARAKRSCLTASR